MPVYNVAAYLPACLDSLMAQTVMPDEIIVVDDGSTDDCPQILADYASRMPQMRIIRQSNRGLSEARNTGLNQAHGRWLAFIDSDDFISPNLYARLLDIAESGNLDVALCNAWYHYEERKPDRLIYPDSNTTHVISGKELLKQRLIEKSLLHAVWMHLYRRDFIEDHGFRFEADIIHEDVVWTTRVMLAAQQVRYVSEPLYHYRIPIRRFSAEALNRRLENLISSSVHNARSLASIAMAEAQDEELQRLLEWQLVDGAFSVFHKIEKLTAPKRRLQHKRELRRSGFYRFLWQKAVGAEQKRRVIHRYLRSWSA